MFSIFTYLLVTIIFTDFTSIRISIKYTLSGYKTIGCDQYGLYLVLIAYCATSCFIIGQMSLSEDWNDYGNGIHEEVTIFVRTKKVASN